MSEAAIGGGGGIREKFREPLVALRDVFRNKALRRLQLAFAGSVVGDWAYAVGLAVYAYDQGGPAAVGILGVVRYVLMAVVTPFTSTLADRLPRKLVMVSSDLTRGVLVLCAAAVIAADGPAIVVYVLAITTSLAATPFRPAQAAILPSLARSPAELTAANVASSTIESVGFFAGPALGGLLLAVADIQTVYVFNAITFVWSAALVIGIRVTERDEQGEEVPAEAAAEAGEAKAGFLTESMAGFSTILRSNDLRVLALIYCAQTVVAGASLVFVVAIALDLLDLGRSGVGYLDSVLGVGGLLGGFLVLVLAQRGKLAFDFGVGVALWAVPLLLIAVSPTLAAAAVAMFVVGLGNSLVDINAYTILQRIVPDEVMGRVFGALESALIGAMALGALLMPILIETIGLRAGLVAVGGAVSAVVVVGIPGLRRIDAVALAPPGLELLRSVSLFSPLPEPVLEHLARSLIRVEAAAGDVVIRQGDRGDRVYVIESGTVEVTKDGRHIAHLGPGDYVGEIALLRYVPRTATVTATTDVVLQALEASVFLPAVTGSGEVYETAQKDVSRRLAML
jgi:MFS family permease